MTNPLLVCLLPVRNSEADLPGYLDSVAHFADVVIALDDGSTDCTREILQTSPLVKIVLENPPRPDYVGWDDAANRNRLLEAAAELAPAWILSLDADERIPPDDGVALRAFLETDAMPGLGYGFKVYRMWDDLNQYDRAGLWVYRLFAWQPGQRFPDRRLHFVPLPDDLPRSHRVHTTIRIQHLGGLTEERRQARFEKYRQVDPNNEFQHSYRDLLDPALALRAWEPRPANLPVLDVSAEALEASLDDAEQPGLDEITGRPALSAIIISRDDGPRLLRTVQSVVEQECPWPFEVIVVVSGSGDGASLVREQFPQVTVVELPKPALPGEARNAGLRVARGDFISFPGSHVTLRQGSLAARLRAHDLGYAMVTGTTLNGRRTPAGWASYFLDHSTVLPGRPSTELRSAPAHCSYRRSALEDVGGFPEDLRAGEDTVVNQELVRRGHRAYRAQEVVLVHRSPCRTVRKLASHHFTRGRGYGRILRDRDGMTHRDLATRRGVRLLRQQTVGRLQMISRQVRTWAGPRLATRYVVVFPLVVVGCLAWTAGTWFELLRQSPAEDTAAPNTTAIQAS
jgi:glycosyltransferase involved in cell wall biosynthesis